MKYVTVTIDRPLGYIDSFNNKYPINYGYVKGIIAGDGEEQDAYIISETITKPLVSFTGIVIAIVKRKDDVEDKWIVTSENETYTTEVLYEKVAFIEQFFDATIELTPTNQSPLL